MLLCLGPEILLVKLSVTHLTETGLGIFSTLNGRVCVCDQRIEMDNQASHTKYQQKINERKFAMKSCFASIVRMCLEAPNQIQNCHSENAMENDYHQTYMKKWLSLWHLWQTRAHSIA